MPLPLVRSPLGLPLGGPGLLPGPPALPRCWPEAYIIQYCGSFKNVRTLLDTYTSGAWGGCRPPLVPNKFVSGGPPLDSLSSRDRSEVALHGTGMDGGATPYFRTASAYQGRSTLHGRRTRDRGAAPYFIPALESQNSSAPRRQRSTDRGASGYFSTAIQVRVWGVSPYFKPQLQVLVPRPDGQMTRDGGLPFCHSTSWGARRRCCRQVPLPRRSEHRSGRRWPLPPPRR